MHLVGQHSNPSELLEAVLGWVPDGSPTRRREPIAGLLETKRLGNGVVQRAVVRGFAVGGRTMDISEAQRAAEAVLGGAVPPDTGNNFVSTRAPGPAPRFERVAHGRYRLAG